MLTHNHLRSLPTKEQQLDKLRDAEVFIWCAHHGQERKLGDREPFATHPQGVVDVLREAGVEDTDTLIAALLHDTVEMGKVTLEVIEERYGKHVRDIVDGVTKRKGFATRELKLQDYLGRLDGGNEYGETAPEESLLVALADKIHNIEDLIKNHKALIAAGESTDNMWAMFKEGSWGTLQWHKDVLAIGQVYYPDHPLTIRLERGVDELERLLLASSAIKLYAMAD